MKFNRVQAGIASAQADGSFWLRIYSPPSWAGE
jgi:hypothetical protein